MQGCFWSQCTGCYEPHRLLRRLSFSSCQLLLFFQDHHSFDLGLHSQYLCSIMVQWKEMRSEIRNIDCKATPYYLWDRAWSLPTTVLNELQVVFRINDLSHPWGHSGPWWLKPRGRAALTVSRLVQATSRADLAESTVSQVHGISGGEHCQLCHHSWLLCHTLCTANRTSSAAGDRQDHAHHGQVAHGLWQRGGSCSRCPNMYRAQPKVWVVRRMWG